MTHMYVLWRLQKWLKLHVKGHFVSAKHFYVLRTQLVGSAQFISMKLSGCHIGTYKSKLKHSKVEMGPYEKIAFFPPDSLAGAATKNQDFDVPSG